MQNSFSVVMSLLCANLVTITGTSASWFAYKASASKSGILSLQMHSQVAALTTAVHFYISIKYRYETAYSKLGGSCHLQETML